MKIMQIAKNKAKVLSVTAQTQNHKFSPNKSAKNAKYSLNTHIKDEQFSGCADGICEVTWKPLQHSA